MTLLSGLPDFAVVLMPQVPQNHHSIHTAAKVAAATQLPAPTVAKVLVRLCREGLLASIRGVNGGYILERPASAISVGAIFSTFDGPVALTKCIKPRPGRCTG